MSIKVFIFICFFVTFIGAISKRESFYEDVTKYSDGKVKMDNLPDRGLSIVALQNIDKGEILFKIPKQFTICNSLLFPFKYEILEAREILPQDFDGDALLVYLIMYHFYADKEEIKKYIKANELVEYYDYPERPDIIKDSFAVYTPNYSYYEKWHCEFIENNFGKNCDDEFRNLFETVIELISKNKHKDMILPWINNYDNFIWVYSNVHSRTFNFSFENLVKLENYEGRNLESPIQINFDKTKDLISEGMNLVCILCYIDLCNHKQSKYFDSRDKYEYEIQTSENIVSIVSGGKFYKGEEVLSNYNNEMSTLSLFSFYGFIVQDNVFDHTKIHIKLDTNLRQSQIDLCSRIDCLIPDKKNLKNILVEEIYYSTIYEALLFYGRVRILKGMFNIDEFAELFKNNQIINLENEIGAWLFYYDAIIKNKEEDYIPKLISFIYGIQYYRNIAQSKTVEGLETFDQHKRWGFYKIFEYIINTEYNEKRILNKHSLGSLNHIILFVNRDLMEIKGKYLI